MLLGRQDGGHMNELSVFENEQFGQVRTIQLDGEPWFVAADVCRALDIANVSNALARLDVDEKGIRSMDTLRGEQEMSIVNEPGLYTLVLGSRKKEAKAFKRWITHEVIPSIRKHGAYLTPAVAEQVLSDPDLIIRMAQQIKDEREQRKRLESQIDEDKPFTDMGRFVYGCDRNVRIGDYAKLLPNAGIHIGPRKLHEWMKKNGYIAQDNSPVQRYVDAGIFRARVVKGERAEQDPIYFSPTITPKGQQFFIEKLKADEAIRWTEAEEK